MKEVSRHSVVASASALRGGRGCDPSWTRNHTQTIKAVPATQGAGVPSS